MRKLKTPEEIIQEHVGVTPGAKPLTPMDYGECVNVIIAAQRDALECAAENATIMFTTDKVEENGDFTVKKIVDKESILNLIPKE